jgi:hypothetical protein
MVMIFSMFILSTLTLVYTSLYKGGGVPKATIETGLTGIQPKIAIEVNPQKASSTV